MNTTHNGSSFCIFHDREYAAQHEDELYNTFMQQVAMCIDTNKTLYCIGYNLPDIRFVGINFNIPIYFSESTIHSANFSESSFSDTVSFSGVIFLGEASFYQQ
jgi:hypothetical protein